MDNKERLIIRQSSITRAVEFYNLLNLKPTMLELVATADHFSQYVENGLNKEMIEKCKGVDKFIQEKQK
jgi:hypothetical protein